jgi:hypothetical protein
VTSSVSGKRSPAELIAPGSNLEVETGIEPVCTALQAVASPLGHSTAGVDATAPRADDGIRTRDPHLGKVMRYQLRYIRAPRTTSSPVAKDDDSPQKCSRTNPIDRRAQRPQNSRYASREIENPWLVRTSRHVIHHWALSHRSTPAVIDWPYGNVLSAPKAVSPAQTN